MGEARVRVRWLRERVYCQITLYSSAYEQA